MDKVRSSFEVGCPVCKVVVGIVQEIEDIDKRAGYFRNECKPSPMPVKCVHCAGTLTRF